MAKKRIILIDNYVDETVLTLLDKRLNGVTAVIYTQQISRQFQLDVDHHNAQYAPIGVNTFRLSHDRFLCIDNDVYHIGGIHQGLGKEMVWLFKNGDTYARRIGGKNKQRIIVSLLRWVL